MLAEENQKLKRENAKLIEQSQKLKKEKTNLEKRLVDCNSLVNEELAKLEEKYKKLIKDKETIIDALTSKLNSNVTEFKDNNNLFEGGKPVVINFVSDDQQINWTIICSSKMKFYNVEGQLYEKYPQYKEGEKNFFLFNEKKINKYESLEDNEIHEYVIKIKKIEE